MRSGDLWKYAAEFCPHRESYAMRSAAGIQNPERNGSQSASVYWCLVALALSACTADVSLTAVGGDPNALEGIPQRQSIRANVCAPPAVTQLPPYKVMFIVDTSGSMSSSDPNGYRKLAVSNAVQAYSAGDPDVSFAVITFNSTFNRLTFGFTSDGNALAGAYSGLNGAQGGTDYSDTIYAATEEIINDVTSLDVTTALRTHYLVFFLTDGVPSVPGLTTEASLVPGVTNLIQSVKNQVAEVQFNTAFLQGASDANSAQIVADATQLLTAMALAGNGNFTSIAAGQQFNFAVNIQPVTIQYQLRTAIVNDRNTQFGRAFPAVDSDADGLTDAEELTYATDPTNPDTDGDNYRDGFEVLFPQQLNPTRFDAGCANTIDTDQDGLYDCEEAIEGTSPINPDTDADFLPDGLEVFAGSSPLQASGSVDSDLDGYSDFLEVTKHTPVNVPNTSADLESWGYTYQITPGIEAANGANCYTLSVTNLAMYETLATAKTVIGENTFETFLVFSIAGRQSSEQFSHSFFNGRFRLPNYEDPIDGVISLDPNSFIPLPY